MIDQVRKYKLDPIPRGNLTGVVNRNVCTLELETG